MQSHLNVLNQEDVKESCKSLQVELKPLTASLKYVVMSPNSTYHVIINTGLYDKQIEWLLTILKTYKSVIEYTFDDIKGINLSLCMIILEDE